MIFDKLHKFELLFQNIVSQFLNSPPIVADFGTEFELLCNISDITNLNLQWIRSLNKVPTGPNASFIVEPNNRTQILDSGKKLYFKSVSIVDDEYFACGYRNQSTGRFPLISRYNVFVRGILLIIYFKSMISRVCFCFFFTLEQSP